MNPTKTWDRACRLRIRRINPVIHRVQPLDRGVNYFVMRLEQLGAFTRFSCEGHPNGFYVVFTAPFETALMIQSCGFFSVELEGLIESPHRLPLWSIRHHTPYKKGKFNKKWVMRLAADAWEKKLGPLDWKAARKFERSATKVLAKAEETVERMNLWMSTSIEGKRRGPCR